MPTLDLLDKTLLYLIAISTKLSKIKCWQYKKCQQMKSVARYCSPLLGSVGNAGLLQRSNDGNTKNVNK